MTPSEALRDSVRCQGWVHARLGRYPNAGLVCDECDSIDGSVGISEAGRVLLEEIVKDHRLGCPAYSWEAKFGYTMTDPDTFRRLPDKDEDCACLVGACKRILEEVDD